MHLILSNATEVTAFSRTETTLPVQSDELRALTPSHAKCGIYYELKKVGNDCCMKSAGTISC